MVVVTVMSPKVVNVAVGVSAVSVFGVAVGRDVVVVAAAAVVVRGSIIVRDNT